MYWAMRTSRDTPEHREFLRQELSEGRLRQGWGGYPEQDLRYIEEAWREGRSLTKKQADASWHWRMGDGPAGDYMNNGDVVLVPNMPHDGFFTLVRIRGPYEFEINGEHADFGHLRTVEVLTPVQAWPMDTELVDAGLRRSLRYQGRLWRISNYAECLETHHRVRRGPQGWRQRPSVGLKASYQIWSRVLSSRTMAEHGYLKGYRLGCRVASGKRSFAMPWSLSSL